MMKVFNISTYQDGLRVQGVIFHGWHTICYLGKQETNVVLVVSEEEYEKIKQSLEEESKEEPEVPECAECGNLNVDEKGECAPCSNKNPKDALFEEAWELHNKRYTGDSLNKYHFQEWYNRITYNDVLCYITSCKRIIEERKKSKSTERSNKENQTLEFGYLCEIGIGLAEPKF